MVINIIRWFAGLTLLFGGAVTIATQPLAAFATLVLAALLIPPLEKVILAKLKIKVPTWGKIISGIFLFGLMISATPASPEEKIVETLPSAMTTVTVSAPTSGIEVTSSTPTSEVNALLDVIKVIDGDTVQVNIRGKVETIRLIGVDTPESVDPRKPVQCFALEASKKAKEILTGKKVFLEADSTQGERDKYNRLLRYIFLEDGTNFNKLMIAEGYGHEYTYNKPYKYMEEFKLVETEATLNKKGLWADEACLVVATPTAVPQVKGVESGGSYSCGTKTKCTEMSTCAEARYFLTTCGLSRLDGDSDGTPCEALCN